MPNYWLFKQEPSCYSLADLERDGSTLWDGVTNALARKHLRAVRPGDRVLFYHTGKEKAIVGEMVVEKQPESDPNSDDPKAVVLPVRFARRWKKPVPLSLIKADKELANWELVRMSRLSVMPVTAAQWKRLQAIARSQEVEQS